jgi:hypothetical protein
MTGPSVAGRRMTGIRIQRMPYTAGPRIVDGTFLPLMKQG